MNPTTMLAIPDVLFNEFLDEVEGPGFFHNL